ncbi:iron hydrogenase [Anaeramoeba ignava]|uniref:Iron hydrogenase n=1 Tax=Anaeramoeba ignava TaxID=1746090 RepID=A0A9Q0L7I9_ANAIG|nr:iron hydrogenase [Anaeramoeba ignava]
MNTSSNNTQTIEPLFQVEAHESAINSIEVSTDENQFYTCANENVIKCWDFDTGKCVATLSKHESFVNSLNIHKGILYSCDIKGVLISWDVMNYHPLTIFKGHEGKVSSFHNRNDLLFSGGVDHTIKLWNTSNGNLIRQYLAHTDQISQLYATIDQKRLFSSSMDSQAILWDVENSQQILTFKGHQNWVLSMAFDEEKQILYTGSNDCTIKSWDTKSGKCIKTYEGHEYAVVQLLLYNNKIYSGSWDGKIGIFSEKKSKGKFISAHAGKVRVIQMQDSYLVSGGTDGKIKVWNLNNESCVSLLEGHSAPISTIKISPSGAILSGSEDRNIIRWPLVSSYSKSRSRSLSLIQQEKEKITRFKKDFVLKGKNVSQTKVVVTINGKRCHVDSNLNVLEACRKSGANVQSLCYHPSLHPLATCKFCVVEIEGIGHSFKKCCSCATPIREGMNIRTDTDLTKESLRKSLLNLTSKIESRNMNLMSEKMGNSNELTDFLQSSNQCFIDNSTQAVTLDLSKCIDCGRCEQVCSRIQGISVFSLEETEGPHQSTLKVNGKSLSDSDCIYCGLCTYYCPSDALSEFDETHIFEQFLTQKNDYHLVVGIDPSLFTTISELYGKELGAITPGQIVKSLRILGFHTIFSLQFSSDIYAIELSTELMKRLNDTQAILPILTSNCVSSVYMIEKLYPSLIPHLSTTKSPNQIFGSVVKSYFAQKLEKSPENIRCVTITPCIANKYQNKLKNIQSENISDVDLSITVREFGKILQNHSIDLRKLEEDSFDPPFSITSSAGCSFSVAGGVLQSTLRCLYESQTRKEFPKLEMNEVFGIPNMTEGTLMMEGRRIKVAVIDGSSSIRTFLNKVQSGNHDFDFVEIMACPGGCIGGGGQPKSKMNILPKRIVCSNQITSKFSIQNPNDNSDVQTLYTDFFKSPSIHISYEYLHTQNFHPIHYSSLKTKKTPQTKRRQINENIPQKNGLLVLYGSQTGDAETVAFRIGEECSFKAKSRVLEMDSFNFASLQHEKTIIFVTSTFWNGSFPENATSFWNHLKSLSPNSLNKLKFAVFGVGDSFYPHFNIAGKLLFKKLSELSQKSLLPLGEGDYRSPNGYLSALIPWIEDLKKVLTKK